MNSISEYYTYRTPYGPITIVSKDGYISNIFLKEMIVEGDRSPNDLLNRCANQILEYLAGMRTVFQIDHRIVGSEFQQEVLNAASNIAYGETLTYQDLASIIGKPDSYRSVGQAIKNNPLPIIVPSHRVVSKTGYANRKNAEDALMSALRELERANYR